MLVAECLVARKTDPGDLEPIALQDAEQHEPGIGEFFFVDADAGVVVALLVVQLFDASCGTVDLEAVDRGARDHIDDRRDLCVVDLLVAGDLDIDNEASFEHLKDEGHAAVFVDAGVDLNAGERAQAVQSSDIAPDLLGIEHGARLGADVVDRLLLGVVGEIAVDLVDLCRADIDLADDPVLVDPEVIGGGLFLSGWGVLSDRGGRGQGTDSQGGARNHRQHWQRVGQTGWGSAVRWQVDLRLKTIPARV